MCLAPAAPRDEGGIPTLEDAPNDSANPGTKLRWKFAASTTAANDADSLRQLALLAVGLAAGVVSLLSPALLLLGPAASTFLPPPSFEEMEDGVGDWLLRWLTSSIMFSSCGACSIAQKIVVVVWEAPSNLV